ncbi:hypothetical protein GJ496_008664 [Pomphorhynchus laevis]|nr:hypothetical protein GJ496_008664 [Pomphorhynchus laevis]
MNSNIMQADFALIDGAFTESIELYSALIDDSHPSNLAHIYGHRGCAYFHKGEYKMANKDFAEALRIEPDNLRWRYKLALCDFKENGKIAGLLALENIDHLWIREQVNAIIQTNNPISHEWYQTPTTVVISFMICEVKECKADISQVDRNSRFTCLFYKNDGKTSIFNADLLYEVNQPKVKLLPKKVEVTLLKNETNKHWNSLTKIKENKLLSKQRNWDAILSELDKESKDSEDKGVEDFFKEIYASASDEGKKAMMKSYQESGGTVLSTNWESISKQRVDVQPPDGMEFRKWE